MLMEVNGAQVADDKSLLIVEDDRPFRERLARAMQTRGFEVLIAADEPAAATTAKSRKR